MDKNKDGSPHVVREKATSSRYFYNKDLLPVTQTWNWYNIFAFWMSDVHSVGGYIFAGSLFYLGLKSWEVFASLIIGIVVVQIMANLSAKPSQKYAVPFPVIARSSFGVFGANIPALTRGIIGIVWYGIQTYLASIALAIILLRYFPQLESWQLDSFCGLSYLGWLSFMLMWSLQLALFLLKINAIRMFVDLAGPLVYVFIFILCVWIVYKAGWDNINFNLAEKDLTLSETIQQFFVSVSLVIAYFAGPVLNFGDFSRFCRNYQDVRKGNFWGLPVNFIAFSLASVIVFSGTPAVFGHIISDPIEVVKHVESDMLAVLISFVFIVATMGVNIVANFVSATYDVCNLIPSKFSWGMAGLLVSILAILIMPWKLFSSSSAIHTTIDVLSTFLGPLYAILVVDFYLIKKRCLKAEDLFSDKKTGKYFYCMGFNPIAVIAMLPPFILITLTTINVLNIGTSIFVLSTICSALLYYGITKYCRQRMKHED